MTGHSRGIASGALALLALAGCGDETAEAPPPAAPNLGHPPAAAPPANVVGGFHIDLPALVMQPGEERFPCLVFPLEVEGPSNVVGGGKLTTGPGMHHGNITTRPKTGEGVRPCDEEGGLLGNEAGDIIKGGAVLFGSSTQFEGEEWQSFPDGMGYPIARSYEIVARMHYVNATAAEVTVAPRYEWFTIDEASITQLLGPFAWTLGGWEIPPLATLTAAGECDMPGPMQVVNVLPHMHKLGTEFFGQYAGGALDGQRWLDSKGYDPDNGVITQYTPAIDLGQGHGYRFGCTWKNTFDKSIVEGVGDNEMCILFGYAYPYEHAYSAQATDGGACALVLPPMPE
jgi:hypothetical protein